MSPVFLHAAILAAALARRCATIYTERLSHGQIVDGLQIVDPFR